MWKATKLSVIPKPFILLRRNHTVASFLAQKVKQGQLDYNSAQTTVANSLDAILERCTEYGGGSGVGPKGLYIYGSVGGGKTMLMDLFYQVAPTNQKLRVHFHEFMLDVHRKIHQVKDEKASTAFVVSRRFRKSGVFDPIPQVSKAIRREHWLICFDEFQITDIADAMIIKRLFSDLFKRGLVMVATSNRRPSDLYKHGLQRTNFLPFIPILKSHCGVVHLESGVDYRQKAASGKQSFYYVDDDAALNQVFKVLISNENDRVGPKRYTILGRDVEFKKTCGRVLDTTFDELCGRDLGSIDYVHLSHFFHTVLIRDVPQLSMKLRTETKRFTILIDTFYDNRTRIVISADTPLQTLFVTEKGDRTSGYTHEEIFAFDRTLSRITEMCSQVYWDMNKR